MAVSVIPPKLQDAITDLISTHSYFYTFLPTSIIQREFNLVSPALETCGS